MFLTWTCSFYGASWYMTSPFFTLIVTRALWLCKVTPSPMHVLLSLYMQSPNLSRFSCLNSEFGDFQIHQRSTLYSWVAPITMTTNKREQPEVLNLPLKLLPLKPKWTEDPRDPGITWDPEWLRATGVHVGWKRQRRSITPLISGVDFLEAWGFLFLLFAKIDSVWLL